MRFVLRLWSILTTIPNRLVAQWGLVLASITGLIASISLVMSVPLYADAVYMRILTRKIYQPEAEKAVRPPFSFLFIMNGGSKGTKQWEEIQPFDDYFMGSGGSELGIPIKSKVSYTRRSHLLFSLWVPQIIRTKLQRSDGQGLASCLICRIILRSWKVCYLVSE